LNRLVIPRTLAAGGLVTAATGLRLGTSCIRLLVRRAPPLVRLAVTASAGRAETAKAQAAFRDELVALARDSAEVSWRELRRGVDDLDAFTRSDRENPERPYRRPYRVKS
jgi:hypothetical protein